LAYVITFMLIGQVWANHHVMFDHIRHADRLVLFLNTVLLMDIALLPFAAEVLANSFRDGQGERTAVVVHGIAFELAAALFNVIWWHARQDRRLLANTIDAAGVRAITRRFLLARLDRRRNAARRAAASARRDRDRCVRRLLLAADLRGDRPGKAAPGAARRREAAWPAPRETVGGCAGRGGCRPRRARRAGPPLQQRRLARVVDKQAVIA
jgi:hypothetical protein